MLSVNPLATARRTVFQPFFTLSCSSGESPLPFKQETLAKDAKPRLTNQPDR
jgi:hypothetical protein